MKYVQRNPAVWKVNGSEKESLLSGGLYRRKKREASSGCQQICGDQTLVDFLGGVDESFWFALLFKMGGLKALLLCWRPKFTFIRSMTCTPCPTYVHFRIHQVWFSMFEKEKKGSE